MTARIYSPSKTAMQSGKAKTGLWILEFDRDMPRTVEPLMGYTSSADPLAQVRLKFESREDAIAYAEKRGIAYRLDEPKDTKRRVISYSDNFKYDRKYPWTH